jgi:hypothetical protein
MRLDEEVLMDFFREYTNVTVRILKFRIVFFLLQFLWPDYVAVWILKSRVHAFSGAIHHLG